jgi:hypothetical protein
MHTYLLIVFLADWFALLGIPTHTRAKLCPEKGDFTGKSAKPTGKAPERPPGSRAEIEKSGGMKRADAQNNSFLTQFRENNA